MYKILSFLFCISFISLFSQNNEKQQIKSRISLFFKGLQNGDSISLKQTLYKDFVLQSISTDSNGISVLHNVGRKSFIKAIGSKNPKDLWREDILSYKFNIDGAMAEVWMPFKFYLNNKLLHCGINSFQLFKNRGSWKIIYIVDTRKKKCDN